MTLSVSYVYIDLNVTFNLTMSCDLLLCITSNRRKDGLR